MDKENTVTLSTLHSSKGLEWENVWIIDSSEGKSPPKMKESPISVKNCATTHLESERRLYYVGITRAQYELNISFVGEMGQFLATSNQSLATLIDHTLEEENSELIEDAC